MLCRKTLRTTQVDYPGSYEDIARFIIGVVKRLKPEEFCRSETLDFDPRPVRVDVYGVVNDDGVWYVKFYVQEGNVVVVVSCHEPDPAVPLKRVDGRTLRGKRP